MVKSKDTIYVRIGQIAEMNSVSVTKLNYYIDRNLIEYSAKSKSGQRLFDPVIVKDRLKRIDKLKKSGKTLEKVKKILNKE